jgi:glycosyltransferase involved in cell wall biosynthesis
MDYSSPTKPEVSIVIPLYNKESSIKSTIESVLNQTYKNFEVTILDDCSTDNSLAIINEYKDNPHVKQIVVNEHNTGNTFIQWERGFNLAQGELIWIAESDDYAEPQLLEKAIEAFQKNKNVVLTFCHSRLVDADGNNIETYFDKHSPKTTMKYDGRDFIKKRCLFHCSVYNASMAVFKKCAISNVNPYYKNLQHCGDWAFWTEIAFQGDVMEIPQEMNYFRKHGNNVTTKGQESEVSFRENAIILQNILDKIELTPYQKKCIYGRFSSRLNDAKKTKKALKAEFPAIYGGSWFEKIIYKIDKIFNFSKLNFKKI